MIICTLCFTVLCSLFVCLWLLGYHLEKSGLRFLLVLILRNILKCYCRLQYTSGFDHLTINIWNWWNHMNYIIRNVKSTIFSFSFIHFISLSVFYKDQIFRNKVFNWKIFPWDMLLVLGGNLLETVTKPNEVRLLLPLLML